MIKIKIKKTGKVYEETRNVAFDLIDRGIAEVFKPTPVVKPMTYMNRQMRTRTR